MRKTDHFSDVCWHADTCALAGAAAFFAGIPDAAIVVNGPMWCYFYAMRHLEDSQPLLSQRMVCTQLDNEAIVFGTEEYLRDTLAPYIEKPPALLCIESNCSASLIGDDMAGIAREMGIGCPVVVFDSGGLTGGFAEGYAKQSMYGLLWGVLANLVLDVLLIGVLRMGAAGSGWALMGTNVACIIYYMLFLTAKSKNFSWSLKDFTLSADVLKPVLSVGSSQMVSSLFLVVSALVLNNLAVKYGDAAVASFGVSIRLIMVPQTLCTGICMGSIPLFAYTYGAGNRERLRAALKVAVLLSVGTSAVFSIPVWAFRDWALYLAGGPSIITAGDQVLTALLFSTVFYALVMLLVAWFQACGKGVAAVVLTASVGVFFFVTVFAGDTLFGFTGLTWAFPVTQMGSCALGVALFWASGRTRIRQCEKA